VLILLLIRTQNINEIMIWVP